MTLAAAIDRLEQARATVSFAEPWELAAFESALGGPVAKVGDTWVLDDSGWSCVEFDFDLAEDRMQMFVTTPDGRFDDTEYLTATFRDEASGPGGVFTAVDIIGGYFASSTSDPDNYYTIDDLVIDTAHIGPPPGFAP